MLWESVIASFLGLAAFGLVSGVKGKTGMYLRMVTGTVVAIASLNASVEFFDHPGWDGALEGKDVGGRASAVFMLGYLAGPSVLGVIFLLIFVATALGARGEWLDISGKEPGQRERAISSGLSLIFHPVELTKLLTTKGRDLLAVPGLAVVLASIFFSVSLFSATDNANKSPLDYATLPGPSLVTALIALFVAWVAYQQWKTNGEKLRLDLYNRRFDVYAATLTYYQALVEYDPIANQESFKEVSSDFIKACREALFLFDKASGVSDILQEMHSGSFKVLGIRRHGKELAAADPQAWSKMHLEANHFIFECDAHLKSLEKAMAPYLNFHQIGA